MRLPILLVITIIASIAIISYHEVLAQAQPTEQTTLSGDLANDPIAQDILRKIEQTKQWIEDLERREYEKTQAQKLLEEKRAVALERLNNDLLEWENLWANYTSRAAFERFVADKPTQVKRVFWDAFEFKEMKVNAGREALKKVVANGGTLSEARAAYHKAAETKRIELIEQNTKFNIKHNLAYYQEQILFDKQGEFIEADTSQEKLGNLYSDYKQNPAYLAANPDDKFAAEPMYANADTKCREGYVLIYRFQQSDYICVTEFSSQQWIRYGIAEIPGIAEIVVEELDSTLSTNEQKEKLNRSIDSINQEFQIEQAELTGLYDKKYLNVETLFREKEKQAIKEFTQESITKRELTQKLSSIRSQIDIEKENILSEKMKLLEEHKVDYENKVLDVLDEYKDTFNVKLEWNNDKSRYDLIWE